MSHWSEDARSAAHADMGTGAPDAPVKDCEDREWAPLADIEQLPDWQPMAEIAEVDFDQPPAAAPAAAPVEAPAATPAAAPGRDAGRPG